MSDQHLPGSLIVTFYGAYGRVPTAGTVPVAELIRLLGAVGVDAPSVRSAVSRLKRRGLLVADRARQQGAAGYAPSPDARQLLDDGDRRVYAAARRRTTSGWLLAVFSVPESEAAEAPRAALPAGRARLRQRGARASGSRPAHLDEETRHTLERLRLDPYVDLFRGDAPGLRGDGEAVARWWDLDAIAKLHEAFLDRHEPVLHAWSRRATPRPEEAYRDYLLALDAWRRLPYADPGLPTALLPGGLAGRALGGGLPRAARAAAGRGGDVRGRVTPDIPDVSARDPQVLLPSRLETCTRDGDGGTSC